MTDRSVSAPWSSEPEVAAAVDRYQLLIEHSPDIVLFVGGDGLIVDANRAATEAYGWPRELLAGRSIRTLCHDDGDPDCAFARALTTGQPVRIQTRHRRRDGSRFPVELSVAVTESATGRLALGIVRDVSVRRRWQLSQSVLHGIDQRILKGLPVAEILRFAAEGLAETYDAQLVQISLKGADGSVDIRECAGTGADFLRSIRVRWDDSPEGQGPTGSAIRTGRPQRRNLETDPGFGPWRVRALALGLRSALALPLIAHGRVTGALTLFVAGERVFGTDELEELHGFADQVALSILNAAEQQEIQLQRTALEAVANGVLITNVDGTIRWVNPAFTEMTGWSLEEIRGLTPRILKSGSHAEEFYREMWTTLLEGRVWHGELFNRRKDGSVYIEETTVTPVAGPDGRPESFVAVKKDITERKGHEERLRRMALHDPLTELPNRRALESALERVAQRASQGQAAAMLLVDVDDFKAINDTHGHLAGDSVLLCLSGVLQNALRPGDLLARLGGDEFAVLLDSATGEEAAQVAERLRRAVDESRLSAAGRPVCVTVSVGVARISGLADVRSVLLSADCGLYSAKGLGKNRVVVVGPENDPAALSLAARDCTRRIEEALEEGRFVVHYQPVVKLADGEPIHFEALVRMLGDEGELIPPADFLDQAERFGLMSRVDLWVVEEVLALLCSGGESRVFVNLSGASLSDEKLLATIEEKILEAGIARGRLAFEITESTAITDLNATRRWIGRLKALGCLFALDDFGVGFSSFAYLKALPVDYIKIDRSFVRDVATNATTRAVVEAVRSVALSLGKGVIAEGVESDGLAELLLDLGIEHAQGFRWGKPARADMLPRLLAAPVGLVPERAQIRPDRTHPEWRIE